MTQIAQIAQRKIGRAENQIFLNEDDFSITCWDRQKFKFIGAASFLVVIALLFNAFFNWSSLEKKFLESNLLKLNLIGEQAAASPKISPVTIGFDEAKIEVFLEEYKKNLIHEASRKRIGSEGLASFNEMHLTASLVYKKGESFRTHGDLESVQELPVPVINHIDGVLKNRSLKSEDEYLTHKDKIYIGHPVAMENWPGGSALILTLDRNFISGLNSEKMHQNIRILLIFMAACVTMVVLILNFAVPNRCEIAHIAKKRNAIIIVSACIFSQAAFSCFFLIGYKGHLIELKAEEARLVQMGLANTLTNMPENELSTLSEDHLKKIVLNAVGDPENFKSVAVNFSHEGEKLGVLETFESSESLMSMAAEMISDDRRLKVLGKFNGKTGTEVEIALKLSTNPMLPAITEMILDCITIFIISILIFVELLYLFYTLFQRARIISKSSGGVDYRIMRPAVFLLLFAIDLSMSFIPLHMEKLYEPLFGLSKEVILGLPITVEFIFVGLSIVISGYWVDRRGWHEPFLVGVAFTTCGILYSWLAPSCIHFMISRGLAGAGYGLALMASQGFVITFSDLKSKGQALAILFAGLYAGSISGGATGAMIADRYGYNFVFLIGAVILILLSAYTLLFMRSAMFKPSKPHFNKPMSTPVQKAGLKDFFKNRVVICLILFSSLPASIAVVGFLNYFSPIYLHSIGVTQSSIGRILMIYGVCLVYIGPAIGKYVDLSKDKKIFVFAGCFLGSLTFLMFYLSEGIVAAVAAVFIMGLSSSFILASQSAYMLNLKITRQFGEGKAIGIFRSSSRIGQAMGPIVFGSLMVFSSLENGMKLFGLIYLLTALIFFLFTQRDRKYALQEV